MDVDGDGKVIPPSLNFFFVLDFLYKRKLWPVPPTLIERHPSTHDDENHDIRAEYIPIVCEN